PVAGVLVLQQFPFSSGLQRMSVVTQELGSDELVVYLKGAPERVASLCRPETVPASFPAHLSLYTQQGFRVIGMAYRSLGPARDLSSISREVVESELTFLGLLILENRLKPETRQVLQELSSARIRSVMVTEQDASVASPFTSKIPNIECVPLLIREGRAALVTSYCMFKYMALYSMSQYLGVLLLYWQLNSFGNYQFLFEDLAINTVIGFTMNLNHAHPKLAPRWPPAQLMSPPMLLSVVLNVILSLALQTAGFLAVQQQAWYLPNDIYSACTPGNASSSAGNRTHNSTLSVPVPDPGFKSYENTTVWLLSLFSCITVAFIFSRGKPFRKAIYTNCECQEPVTLTSPALIPPCVFSCSSVALTCGIKPLPSIH
ncbi:UNVERIFIED_CONTAM: hypothetical protein FKN15_033064, partial [Acipenser sinensis]